MANQEQIIYQLKALCRYDDAGQVFIGYIPRLQLYTQARTEDRLKKALASTATHFIRACADQKILFSVLRESGAVLKRGLTSKQVEAHAKDENYEFVAVAGYHECDELVEVQVPIS